ncbi:MAG: CpaF family protein, partial [Ruminiclostridium sp.]|nr:CpaF family protein [Ruminiclostridium sp.]
MDMNRDFSDEEIRELIKKAVFRRSREQYIELNEKREIIDAVFNSMRRLDILQPIIDDKEVTEIMVNGPDAVFVEKEGRISGLNVRFESCEKLEDVIQSIVSRTNRTVNESAPIVDARLPDGSRVNIVLRPVALNGPIMTIRKFPSSPLSMEQLVNMESLTREAADVLCSLVKARYNIFICGGTGSGKTTFLNALAGYIPGDERIVTIEDSAELQINNIENLVRLETRNANTEGKGQITIRELIRTSLRMRPERIIVGEVRGAEALDMLQAMNTGHDGSISTGHANSPSDMLSRLETMVLSSAPLPLEAIRRQIASAIDIMIHLSRMRDRSRRVLSISEVAGYMDGQIVLNPLYEFRDSGDTPDGRVDGELYGTDNKMVHIS